jgi:demethylmenaquinone methyltransferase/2-methoxy-6-polyprenyl-1,4-benzoquinol methylase
LPLPSKSEVGKKDANQTLGSGKMFDKIAFAYDLGNRWMSLGQDDFWRQTLIKECLNLKPEDKVLDLATGTADVALLIGSRLKELAAAQFQDSGLGATAAVVGVDPSAEMLRRGVQKVRDVGLEGLIHLHQGDAQNLSRVDSVMGEPAAIGALEGVASNSIDKISMSFGIRNVPNRNKALTEMVRVLKKSAGSRVCIL